MESFNFEEKKEEKKIKVLGAGCKSCHEQYENTKRAVGEMGLSIEVEYITDMQKVMEYGVMSMPALEYFRIFQKTLPLCPLFFSYW